MNDARRRLLLEQLDKRLGGLRNMEEYALTSVSWIFIIRKALNMSLRQLGTKLGVTAQNIKQLEQSEKNGTISIRTLRATAEALEMKLVYAFIPKDGSLEKLIEKKAAEKAREIVRRTSHSMNLEEQENSPSRLQKATEQQTEMIIRELPKYLWD